MSDATTPITRVQRAVPKEPLTANKYNQLTGALNRASNGVKPPQQIIKKRTGTSADAIPTRARLVLTDADTAMFGEIEVDGETALDGDYVLRTADDDADGMYQVKEAALWVRVGKLNADHGNDKAPVYEHGTVISIWEGDSAPTQYMVTRDDVEEA